MKLTYTLTLFITTLFLNAQTNNLQLNSNIILPKDSIESNILTTSINEFLVAAQQPNEENKLVLESQKIETFILLDEINGIEKSGKFKENFFYKPYLTNVVSIEKDKYLVQISYMGVNEKTPILSGSFEFIAHKQNNSFVFSSTLIRNTKNWKVLKAGNNTFHYESSVNHSKIKEFEKLANSFDKKLKVSDKHCEFYLTSDFSALQKMIGIDYKLAYNSSSASTLSSGISNKKLILLGSNSATFNNFDPHDLWHDRLSLVISRKKVNKPIDEGCAYLYGGSWGISWKDIFTKFRTKVSSNKNMNWLNNYGKFENFGESKATHLMPEYVLNALFIQKIEKEKGFEGVWEFLNCGPYEKTNENYFKALEKLIGISKTNFNAKVWELINNEK
ncbi:hypothetical protein [Flavobacterium sp. CSZ]|uniref:hypothetical protein n=1 Tax=Flavobacterium sp. CSZ TaxID=2783791 RepID=UPI00188D9AC3|nr:hypothetical protein [Flavobacterium sp. CSZ]MBF4487660.1 hypothetical protein [Flavobacterium sp. CSZ]